MESFSIRDYAARMRITDSGKCWPFPGGGEEGRPLPPITVPRFRWWAGELAAAVSGGGESDMKQEAAVDEQPLSISPTPTRSPPKVKLKTPKKRSIIEIFASAPQIEGSAAAVGANGRDGRRPEELERVVEEENKKKKKKKKKWKEEAVMAWKRKRKMSRRGLKVEIRASEMNKICKPKMISSVHMLQDPMYMKPLGKTSRSIVKNRKKFVRLNRLPKKHKILQAPNLISWNQEIVKKLPICSILKNKKKVTSAIKSRKINNAKATEFIKRCCEKTRHVSFSEKDDILGHSKMDLPQFKSLCKIFSDVLAASSVMNHSSKGNELSAATDRPQLVNSSEKDTNVGVVGSTDASSSPKNQLSGLHGNISHPTIINSCNSSCSSTEKKGSLAIMPDLNHSIETCNDLDCFNPSTANLSATCTYSGDQDFRGSTHKKGSNTLSQTQLEAGLPKTSVESFMPTSKGSFLPSSNASSSLTTMKIHSPHCSASCQTLFNETSEKQCQPNVDADVNCCHHMPENQSGHRCAPKDMHSNVCYPMGYKTFGGSVFLSDSVSTCKGKCTGEDFIGLPLNSQGELIQTHPGTKFIGSYKRQSITLGSHDFLTNKHVDCNNNVNNLQIMKEKALDAYQRDQLHWCQKQYHPTVEQVKHGLSFAEFNDAQRLNIQSNESTDEKDAFLHSTANKTCLSFHDRRVGDVTHDFFKRGDQRGEYDLNYQLEPAMQPTMRLMGKTVVVGDSNRYCHAEGRSRTDNDVLTGESHSCGVPGNYLLKQRIQPELLTHKPCWSSTGNLYKVSDAPSNFYPTTELEPRFDPRIGHSPQNLSRKNICSTARNKMFKADMDSHALPHIAMTKTIGEESDNRGHLYPTIASYRQNLQQHILLNSAHCIHSQGVSCATLGMPKVQFGYHDHESPQTPLIQTPAELPQWLLHAKQQEKDHLFSSTYPYPTPLSQPYGFSETNLISHLSPHFTPMVPFSVNYICPAQTSAFAINSSQPSFLSVAMATKLISGVNSTVDGTHSKFTGFNSTSDGYKFRRRPTDMDDVLMNPAKRPNYKGSADPSSPVGQQGSEVMHDHSVLNKTTPNEMSVFRNKEGSSFSRLDYESAERTT